jgi:thioredoxin 1
MDEELEKIRKRKLKELQELMNKSPLPNTPIDLTDQDIEQAIKEYPKLVVDCWAVWCGPCRIVGPTIEALAAEKGGEIVFGKLDIDQNGQSAVKYTISAVPTMLVFKDGQLAGRIIGALPKPQIEAKLNEIFK